MPPAADSGLSPGVAGWLRSRSSSADQWPVDRLLAGKDTTRISVVLPARDEEATVGTIVAAIKSDLMDAVPLVDEIVVVDSHSSDRTAAVAAAAGAIVVEQDAVLAQLPAERGKGDALWKGLATSCGEVVVFVDSDLRDFSTSFVTGLLGPLLHDPTVGFVKGYYHRPLAHAAGSVPDGGGRVSELLARPLINAYWPELAGFVQPLAGEYAGRRDILEGIPFVTGYGVELAMLVDLLELLGLDALAQVDLGVRHHRHHALDQLSRMAGQILLTATARLQRHGRAVFSTPPNPTLAQFCRLSGQNDCGVQRELVVTDLAPRHRPSLASVRAGVVEEAC